ncbi:MAG: NAD(P)H-dependent oxidoreductase [Armatimonadota bacterium]|nr:NAD(P)H-dependent oxidoreductase [Armatimonadota bacterium]
MHLLAISGSLRAGSSNTVLLRAAAQLAPKGVEITLYDGLGDLPHFNPDLDAEGEAGPEAVEDFRARLREADGVLISSPEYAHGVPSVLKNALDWVVGSGEFVGKPVALLNARPNSTFAQASLTETLTVMMAVLVAEASATIPLPGNTVDEAAIVADSKLSDPLRAALTAFARAVAAHP